MFATIWTAVTTFHWLTSSGWWLAALGLSVPHWLYAFIWTKPAQYKKLSNQFAPKMHPVNSMALIAQFIKAFQILVLLVWYLTNASFFPLENHPTFLLLVSVPLLIFGQFLNASIYKAIGVDGVYYGCRLGKDVPWCTSFPFTHFKHPQYVGSGCTIAGLVCLGLTPVSAAAGILQLGLAWMTFYLVSDVDATHCCPNCRPGHRLH